MRLDARTNAASFSSDVVTSPSNALRIAGPFPALRTPLRSGDTPHHSLRQARSVPNPTPAGTRRSHHRSRRAKSRRNASNSPPPATSDCATITVCSVSSLHNPRPAIMRCRSGRPPHRRSARRRLRPSRGRPIASPTAVPTKQPLMWSYGIMIGRQSPSVL